MQEKEKIIEDYGCLDPDFEPSWPGHDDKSASNARGFRARAKAAIKSFPGFDTANILRHQSRLMLGLKARRLSAVAPPPARLLLESSGLCNMHCSKCGNRLSSRDKGLMDTDMALDLVDQAARMGVRHVSLSMLGEPLMHEELETIIKSAREKGLMTHLVTNGMLLSKARSKSLAEAGITQIVVSVDGWDAVSYKARRQGGDLDKVLDNIRGLRDIRGSKPLPFVACKTVLDVESISRLADIKRLLLPFADDIRIIPLIDFGIPGLNVDSKDLPGKRSMRKQPCSYLWNQLNVGWDGTVSACCNDHNYMLAYHHVNDAPLEEIWKSGKIHGWRELHLKGRFERMPMCGPCTYDWINSLAFQRIKHRFKRLAV